MNKSFNPTLFPKIILFSVSLSCFSQPENLSLNRDILRMYEQRANAPKSTFHTSVKPYLASEIRMLDSVKEFTPFFGKNKKQYPSPYKKYAVEIVPCLLLNPVYDLRESGEDALSLEMAAGPLVKGHIGDKFAFSAHCWLGQGTYPGSVDSIIQSQAVIPGMGYAYGNNRKYSYQHYAGYLSYSPNDVFNIQAGMDKHFLGDGYRSLFLSDVSNTYPFLKVSASVWKIKYVSIWASLKDVSTSGGLKKDFTDKYGVFHYLSWNVFKRLNLIFFESVIWQGTDSVRSRGYDVNYLNPVIFLRPVEYSLGSSDNSMMGFAFKVKAGKKQVFYGQLLLDEFLLKEVFAVFKKLVKRSTPYGWWGNKQGGQLGFKSFDLFGLRGLNFQSELNIVRPFTYSHGSPLQNYGHYNQPLAHPLGANFIEQVSFLSYRYNNLMVEGKLVTTLYGADSSGINKGQNIYKSYTTRSSEYGNKIAQGVKTHLLIGELRCTYMIFPKWNFQLECGISSYLKKNTLGNTDSFLLFAGFKSALGNRYNDF